MRTVLYRLALCGLTVLAAAGCQNDDVARYTALRIEEPTVRLLAAIFARGGEESWVFRLVGPEGDVGRHAADFERFVAKVRINEKDDPPLSWKLPEGWKLQPGREMVHAVLKLEDKENALEVTVSHLRGPEAGSVLANVNRWRKQLGLAEVTASVLPQVTRAVKAGELEATVVDLAGRGRVPAMAPRPTTRRAPPSKPLARPAGPQLTYRRPDGWKQYQDPNGIAVAAFQAAEGDQVVEITATPLQGAAGGLTANVNRWREQVGLPPAAEAELQRDIRELEVAGGKGQYVDLIGAPGAGGARQRIVGIIAPHKGVTWFFKMRGPADAVERQRAAFDEFVRSVRFGGGGSDG